LGYDFGRLSSFNPAIERVCTAPIPAIQVPYIFRVDDQGLMKQKKKKEKREKRRSSEPHVKTCRAVFFLVQKL
jgi:hypothetical protein